MDDRLRRLAHRGLTFNAPLSDERAAELVAALPISPGHHVLDVGCGWAELLLRILEAHPATTGTGVDSARDALDRGRAEASRRGLHERVELVEADGATFLDTADLVLCVGSSHALGGMEAALAHLHRLVTPGGRVLFADGYWAAEPSPAALETIGVLPRLEELHRAAVAAGFRPVQVGSSTRAEWDAFESGWRSGLARSGDAEAVALAETRRLEYENGYRDAIGFAWLVLAPTEAATRPA